MEQARDELYLLIHRMDKAEKRYFKLFVKATAGKSGSKALSLFDTIAKSQGKDDEAIDKRIQKAGLNKNLSYLKNYLYKLILKCLVAKNIDIDQKTSFDYAKPVARILISHGLTQAAEEYMTDAEQKAAASNEWFDLLNMSRLDYIPMTLRNELNIDEVQHHLQQQEANFDAAKQNSRLKSYLIILRKMIKYDASQGYWDEYGPTIQDIVANEKPIGFKNGLNLQALAILWYLYNDEKEMARGIMPAFQANLEAQPEYITIYAGELYYFINLHLDEFVPTTFQEHKKNLESLIEKAREKVEVSMQWEIEFYVLLHEMEVKYYHKLQDTHNTTQAIESYDKLLQANTDLIGGMYKANLSYLITSVSIQEGAYDRALAELNNLYEYGAKGPNHPYYRSYHLMQLIAHYELGNTDLAQNMHRNIRRSLVRNELLNDGDEVVLDQLGRLLKSRHEEVDGVLRDMQNTFTEHNARMDVQFLLEWAEGRLAVTRDNSASSAPEQVSN